MAQLCTYPHWHGVQNWPVVDICTQPGTRRGMYHDLQIRATL